MQIFVDPCSLFRHQFSDPSNSEFSSSHGDKEDKSGEATDIPHNVEQQQNDNHVDVAGKSSAEPLYETNVAIELPQTSSYECVSPDCAKASHCGLETNCIPELAGSSKELIPYVQIRPGKESIEKEVHVEGPSHIQENKESAGCDWENLFSDEGDLLLFDTPNDSKTLIDPSQRSIEPGMGFCSSLTNDLQNPLAVNAVSADNNSQLECGRDMSVVTDQDILVSQSKPVAGDNGDNVDDEVSTWLLPSLFHMIYVTIYNRVLLWLCLFLCHKCDSNHSHVLSIIYYCALLQYVYF